MTGLRNRSYPSVATIVPNHVGTSRVEIRDQAIAGRNGYPVVVLEFVVGARLQEVVAAPKEIGLFFDSARSSFNQRQDQADFFRLHWFYLS